MGKLRVEPKVRPFLSDEDFKRYYKILQEAQDAATDNHVFWDLGQAEDAAFVRRAFLHIAEKKQIAVSIKRKRGSQSLSFEFNTQTIKETRRMSAEECSSRIMNALSSANKPMQKSEIISATGISPSTWNIRIRELISSGQVKRQGNRRDTKYSLAS